MFSGITLILLSCAQAEWCLVFSLGVSLCWCANGVSDWISAQLGIGTISEPRVLLQPEIIVSINLQKFAEGFPGSKGGPFSFWLLLPVV